MPLQNAQAAPGKDEESTHVQDVIATNASAVAQQRTAKGALSESGATHPPVHHGFLALEDKQDHTGLITRE